MSSEDEVLDRIETLEDSIDNATESMVESIEHLQSFVDAYKDSPEVIKTHPDVDSEIKKVINGIERLESTSDGYAQLAADLRAARPDDDD